MSSFAIYEIVLTVQRKVDDRQTNLIFEGDTEELSVNI